MDERHYLPVDLLDIVEGLLPALFRLVGCQLLAQVGNLVGCHNGSSHIYRLCHKDGACEDVARICTQGVYKVLSLGIHQRGKTCGIDTRQLLDAWRYRRTKIAQRRFLLITQQRYFLAGKHVGTDTTDMRQVFGTSGTPHVCRNFLLDACYLHLLVIAQSHRPTTVERQQPLPVCRHSYNKQSRT